MKAGSKEEVLRQVAVHLRDVHRVMTPTQTVMNYIAQHIKYE